MPTQLQLDLVEDALLALLQSKVAAAKVRTATSEDFDLDGELIAVPPLVLVVFAAETPDPRRDHLRLTYQSQQQFKIFIGATNLRGASHERKDAYALVNQVRDAVAGAKLTLAGGERLPPLALGPTQLGRLDRNGTWYETRVILDGIAQFTVKE